MNIPESVKQYAQEDIDEVIKRINSRTDGLNANLVSIKFDADSDSDDPDQFSVYPTAIIGWGDSKEHKTTEFCWDYVIDGEDVYMGGDVRELVESLEHKMKYHIDTTIASASSIKHKAAIMAGDGEDEEFIDDIVIDDEEDAFGDTLDDMSDQLDDIQDQVDEVEEDDIDIEMENNIVDHYIAECDGCHGIFISAMIESDQKVDHISGTCPLCEKDTDQRLKWVIKSVEE